MEIRFADPDLERLYTDLKYGGGRAPGVVSGFRKRVGTIEAALDERDFIALRSLHFEKLKGKRDHQYSMRINDQWRLILEFEGKGASKVAVVKSIEDYH